MKAKGSKQNSPRYVICPSTVNPKKPYGIRDTWPEREVALYATWDEAVREREALERRWALDSGTTRGQAVEKILDKHKPRLITIAKSRDEKKTPEKPHHD